MELNKKSIDDLISAADKIIAANTQQEKDLFGEVKNADAIRDIMELDVQAPEKSWELYYENIQQFLNRFLPKDTDISKVIREQVCILLAHKERSGLTYGKRHADSRMAKTKDMEHLIDVLSEWSATPTDYFRLSHILLNKCKELKYVPEDREICDYIQTHHN